MKFKQSFLEGVYEITPKRWEDERGYFFESYHEKSFKEYNIPTTFVQDNQSFSQKDVLRGLHLQLAPFAQAKLVSVMMGSVLDVVVDLRPDSPTFGKHDSFVLDTISNNRVYIPEGFAHGFLTLEDCILSYKCSKYYNTEAESGIFWNDSTLNIDWGTDTPILSIKDQQLPSFKEFTDKFLAI